VVLSVVEEHIDERIARLRRAIELLAVVAVAKEASAPPHDRVHGEGDAREELPHLRREVVAIFPFDDEMKVIVLHGIVHHTHAAAPHARELNEDGLEDPLAPKARRQLDAAHGHVHRMAEVMRLAGGVRHESDPIGARFSTERDAAAALTAFLRRRRDVAVRIEHRDLLAAPPFGHGGKVVLGAEKSIRHSVNHAMFEAGSTIMCTRSRVRRWGSSV
jgi:hypothetical protein